MTSRQARLDKFLSAALGISTKAVKPVLARGRVQVDGVVELDAQRLVHQISRIEYDGQVLQARTPSYLMLNKPAGVVSATKDSQHMTVIDVLSKSASAEFLQNDLRLRDLHIVGRLDFNSTGLMLITNDGRWSRNLSAPESKIRKRYTVTLADKVTTEMVDAFAQGMYFSFEDITTLPAELIILGDRQAEVVLQEGRYHQIKRMFGRFQNEVLTIHRTAVGSIRLDEFLAPGQFRALTQAEIDY